MNYSNNSTSSGFTMADLRRTMDELPKIKGGVWSVRCTRAQLQEALAPIFKDSQSLTPYYPYWPWLSPEDLLGLDIVEEGGYCHVGAASDLERVRKGWGSLERAARLAELIGAGLPLDGPGELTKKEPPLPE